MSFHYGNNEMVNRLAFVGNLPTDATAEEMKQLCSQVGEVILFRIVYDRETGKPKGYGFCEYRDSKLVDSAVDLLHGFEHRGSDLYVRRANQEKHRESNDNESQHTNDNQKNKKKTASSKRKSVEEITRVVASFSMTERKEILSQMKLLIEQNEKGAKEILLENPQLAQALLLIQEEFNLVKVEHIHALTQNIVYDIGKGDDIQLDIDIEKGLEKGLSNQQQNVLDRVMKMTPNDIAKLPLHVQKQVRAVQAQLKSK